MLLTYINMLNTKVQPFKAIGHWSVCVIIVSTPTKKWRILLEQFYCPHSLADANLPFTKW